MNKRTIINGIACIFATFVYADYKAVRGAIDNGATATFDLIVVDDRGQPVEDAQVRGWFWTYRKDNIDKEDTDDKGHAIVKGKSDATGGYDITKIGHYKTSRELSFVREGFDCARETFWGYEWVPPYKKTVVLKTIRNPISVYVGRLERYTYKIPAFNQEFPFDLQKMDWCKPHGKGIRDDVYITLPQILLDFDAYKEPLKLTLKFKHPDEGMYIAESDMFSAFRSDYSVNLSKPFNHEIKLGVKEKGYNNFGNYSQHYVFRIRCKHDENGQIKSANYGKIYGSWLATVDRELGDVLIYFNPTPNDINLEYDAKQNLYKGTTFAERN